MRIVVVGASAAGIFTSLILSRAGHKIVLLDRDPLAIAPDVESAAAAAFRAGAPQLVQPHVLLPRVRELLIQHLPHLYHALIAAGVQEAPISTQMPSTLADKSPHPGDERLTLLMTRRSTFDWVLLQSVAAQHNIEPRFATRSTGILVDKGNPPQVIGLRTTTGDLTCDLVIDASGYRSPIDQWLRDVGAQPTQRIQAECGVAYFSRYHRIRRGATPPGPRTTRLVVGLDEFTVGIWAADNDTVQIAIAPLASDRRFLPVRDSRVFSAVLTSVPYFKNWLDVLEPISDVYAMGAVQNSLRRLVVNERPVVLGLHAIGDAICTTNPTLGRGLGMALSSALEIDSILQHEPDLARQAFHFDNFVSTGIQPFFEDQAAIDAARLAALRSKIFDEPAPSPPAPRHDRVSFAELRSASAFDPILFRAFWRVFGMLAKPDDIYSDPAITERTRSVLAEQEPPSPFPQPSREQLAAALAV
ncbi:NAD(P)/FAD-dependent oxidoreductase [Occallatibacter savannae]|uniref:NAD(P)/FAD-dependent oxidoreductase n=1 Tax=Occallatibacter savannae TaxID=1002691 RepID=UPI0013A5AB10|nr:hypothetical protein [Occallatibacter savannae]